MFGLDDSIFSFSIEGSKAIITSKNGKISFKRTILGDIFMVDGKEYKADYNGAKPTISRGIRNEIVLTFTATLKIAA